MTTMKEAMRDAGLRPTDPSLHAPASHMGRWTDDGAYQGARWNMDRFTDESISLGPAQPRTRKPDDSARSITKLARKHVGEILAGLPQGALTQAATHLRAGVCPSCHMSIPVGHTTCPDC